MDSFMLLLLFSHNLLTIVHADQITCDDGATRTCKSQTIACAADQPCLVQCTAADDCYNTTILCPAAFPCEIDCASGIQRDLACAYMSIDATSSSLLNVTHSAGQRKAFRYSTVYCPFEGGCSFRSDSGREAFRDLHIYSVFGFALDQVSIVCSDANGDRDMTMHCDANYVTSCAMEPAVTPSQCALADAGVCDAISLFTQLPPNIVWRDDFAIREASAWMIRDDLKQAVPDTVLDSDGVEYYGIFQGDETVSDIDAFSLWRYFGCATPAGVETVVAIEFFLYFACTQSDYTFVWVNDALIGSETASTDNAQVVDGLQFDDTQTAAANCSEPWHRTKVVANATYAEAGAATAEFFKLKLSVLLNHDGETVAINMLNVTCIDPTVTLTPTTAAPTTVAPTTITPTLPPTTVAPTSTPTTAAPTFPTVTTTAPTTLSPTVQTTTTSSRQPVASVTQRPISTPRPNARPLEVNQAQQIETAKSGDDQQSGLYAAVGIVGTAFVVVVIFACVFWRKHENKYRSIFQARRNVILSQRESTQQQRQDAGSTAVA